MPRIEVEPDVYARLESMVALSGEDLMTVDTLAEVAITAFLDGAGA